MKVLYLRASSLPRIVKCAGASQPPLVPIQTVSEESDLGTAVHAVLASWIERGPDPAVLDQVAQNTDETELRRLVRWGWDYWCQHFAELFPGPQCERRLSYLSWPGAAPILLAGHPDVIFVSQETAGVLDWKTGWNKAADYTAQIRGYALLVVANHPEVERVYGSVVNVRTGDINARWYTRQELFDWWVQFTATLAAEPTYNPGEWCGWCPRAKECAARQTYLSDALMVLLGIPPQATLPPATRWLAIHKCRKLIQATLDEASDQLKAEVIAAGGRLPIGGEQALVLKEESRRELLAFAAWDYLRVTLGMQALLEVVKIPLGGLKRAVMDGAPQGSKASSWESLLAQLESQGAVIQRTGWPRVELENVNETNLEDKTNGYNNKNSEQTNDSGNQTAGPVAAGSVDCGHGS